MSVVQALTGFSGLRGGFSFSEIFDSPNVNSIQTLPPKRHTQSNPLRTRLSRASIPEFQNSDVLQIAESRSSTASGIPSSSSDGKKELLPSYRHRIDFAQPGQAEILTLGLMAGTLLFPQESWAVDSETVATGSQGLMGWAANEPANALSLPTWIIHVASVAEWVTAMGLVWKYGDTPGRSAWKGLTWGMVPLLGGAMCACTWHFFYNDPSLEVLVVLQAFLTVAGNCTMWAAAYRIWKASQQKAPVK